MYVIPNAVFSKNTVLNVSRKSREWRFYEYLCVRVQDVHKVNAIIQVCPVTNRIMVSVCFCGRHCYLGLDDRRGYLNQPGLQFSHEKGCCERSLTLCMRFFCSPQDIRRIVRNDARIMNKLHRRVFLDKIGMEDVKMYISFYVEASNRDAFMAVKQVSKYTCYSSLALNISLWTHT
jgi:hypothetical protein